MVGEHAVVHVDVVDVDAGSFGSGVGDVAVAAFAFTILAFTFVNGTTNGLSDNIGLST